MRAARHREFGVYPMVQRHLLTDVHYRTTE
jgi:hypothetical protein